MRYVKHTLTCFLSRLEREVLIPEGEDPPELYLAPETALALHVLAQSPDVSWARVASVRDASGSAWYLVVTDLDDEHLHDLVEHGACYDSTRQGVTVLDDEVALIKGQVERKLRPGAPGFAVRREHLELPELKPFIKYAGDVAARLRQAEG